LVAIFDSLELFVRLRLPRGIGFRFRRGRGRDFWHARPLDYASCMASRNAGFYLIFSDKETDSDGEIERNRQ
jgi:hypothetical protein